MKITSKGIINDHEVGIVWTDGQFSVLTDRKEDEVIKDRLACLNRIPYSGNGRGIENDESVAFQMAIYLLSMEMYDKRISLNVDFDDFEEDEREAV